MCVHVGVDVGVDVCKQIFVYMLCGGQWTSSGVIPQERHLPFRVFFGGLLVLVVVSYFEKRSLTGL